MLLPYVNYNFHHYLEQAEFAPPFDELIRFGDQVGGRKPRMSRFQLFPRTGIAKLGITNVVFRRVLQMPGRGIMNK